MLRFLRGAGEARVSDEAGKCPLHVAGHVVAGSGESRLVASCCCGSGCHVVAAVLSGEAVRSHVMKYHVVQYHVMCGYVWGEYE